MLNSYKSCCIIVGDNVLPVVYPGTTDRVCLITGPAACVREAHDVIWETIRGRVAVSNNCTEELQVT